MYCQPTELIWALFFVLIFQFYSPPPQRRSLPSPPVPSLSPSATSTTTTTSTLPSTSRSLSSPPSFPWPGTPKASTSPPELPTSSAASSPLSSSVCWQIALFVNALSPYPPPQAGFVCFVVINPHLLSANRVDLGSFFFLFINFPILPPPPHLPALDKKAGPSNWGEPGAFGDVVAEVRSWAE